MKHRATLTAHASAGFARPGYALLATLATLLAALPAPRAAALEIHYTVYSPITIAPDGEVYVTLDDDGLVRYMEEYVYESEGFHPLIGEDDRPLNLSVTTVVTDTPDGLSVIRTEPDGTVRETITYTFLDERRIRMRRGESTSELTLGASNGERRLVLESGRVILAVREKNRIVVGGTGPRDITQTYEWGMDDYLYTKVRAVGDRSSKAFATFDPDDDLIVAQLPIEDDASPYDWRYDVRTARALLDQEFSLLAAAINATLLGGRGFDGPSLFPLFAINELGE